MTNTLRGWFVKGLTISCPHLLKMTNKNVLRDEIRRVRPTECPWGRRKIIGQSVYDKRDSVKEKKSGEGSVGFKRLNCTTAPSFAHYTTHPLLHLSPLPNRFCLLLMQETLSPVDVCALQFEEMMSWRNCEEAVRMIRSVHKIWFWYGDQNEAQWGDGGRSPYRHFLGRGMDEVCWWLPHEMQYSHVQPGVRVALGS